MRPIQIVEEILVRKTPWKSSLCDLKWVAFHTEKNFRVLKLSASNALMWPTPRTKGMCGGTGAWQQLLAMTTLKEARLMGAGNGGKLNPTWVEWLMGYPLNWTKIKESEERD